MRNGQSIKFQLLRSKLIELGFRESLVVYEGKQARLFEKNEPPNASFYLQKYQPDDLVHPYDVQEIVTVLKSRGIVDEPNPLLSD